MCLDCGCHDYPNCHHDTRHLACIDLDNMVAANPDLTPEEIVRNIREGLDVWLSQQSDDTAKSTHSHDGHHIHISLEPM